MNANVNNIYKKRNYVQAQDTSNYSFDLEDPATWPSVIDRKYRLCIIKKGAIQVKNFKFPMNDEQRSFSEKYYYKTMSNGEKVVRPWLIYSTKMNVVFCFSCRLFPNSKNKTSFTDGFNDWKHLSERIKSHDSSIYHKKSNQEWLELSWRIDSGTTLDCELQKEIQTEKGRWRTVLKRIIACIIYLAQQNDAFRGQNCTIYTEQNGKFLKLIEMIAIFDNPMAEHLRKIKNKEIHQHYLGPRIQTELIHLIGNKIRTEIVTRIKAAKYYTIMLDATPDASHKEQLTLIIRIVQITKTTNNVVVSVDEYFINFLHITLKTGLGLFDVLKQELSNLGICLSNCRGQGYDNGANMVGHKQGVQARILNDNPRALFLPCCAHSLNLLLGDMANCIPRAMTFFGVIQRLYTLFSASTERWEILNKHLKCLTLKPLSETRWECRLESVKAVKMQLKEINNALIEVSESTKIPAIKSEAISLAEHEMSYEFVLSSVIWYNLLNNINKVSKTLQNEKISIDFAVNNLKGLKQFLNKYRENGFNEAKEEDIHICKQIDIKPEFKSKRKSLKKRMFSYESSPILCSTNGEECFVNDFFLPI
ncbi:zinc finger MYM-type protein 1-like [Acyrthosiphon pisum]|uniref:TTF-type domain-containing protein n=1 Tax=Acyrthosiphon pisum TaxID=7029 RepID=A0A8R2A272_ACYPI|nr:zinc finger MYM-type protein 1-like [Acyrthosiphon pisum]|eukprot:XP_001943532.2 PREDICTED: zinc finger MYM-type protein 1-like [Acyrthosiphon pisum]